MNPDFAATQPNATEASVGWIEQTLTGNLAVIVAIIAVATFGLMLMSGRLSTRRGSQLILGCFILFGASSIAAGLLQFLNLGNDGPPTESAVATTISIAPPPTVATGPYDPYAGAALPPRR